MVSDWKKMFWNCERISGKFLRDESVKRIDWILVRGLLRFSFQQYKKLQQDVSEYRREKLNSGERLKMATDLPNICTFLSAAIDYL